jgi:N6-L-threonylcarbamoyladenine synthase
LLISLGIESTAHTFGAGIMDSSSEPAKILADCKDIYKAPAGSGIHPREASRHHLDVCNQVIARAFEESHISIDDVDIIAYSAGPGLGPCLRVGAVVARTLSSYYKKPLVPTNHAVGHIELGKMLCGLRDPLVIVVSGGHTALAAKNGACWKIYGETLDLTIGQLLDQLGRFLGMSSPAGPQIEKLADKAAKDPIGARRAFAMGLPYTVKGNDVSYSGLLSAAKNAVDEKRETVDQVCFAVQELAFSSLAEASERALAFTEKNEVLVTGGVAANQRLASIIGAMCATRGVTCGVIPRVFSGDCGAQIAAASFQFFKSEGSTPPAQSPVRQSWRIDSVCF